MNEYRMRGKKDHLWEVQAESMGRPASQVKDLLLWFKSMRTMYGRITKKDKKRKKSGAGRVLAKLTDRDSWIVKSFSFLNEHIVCIHGKPCLGLPATSASSRHNQSLPHMNTDEETEEDNLEDVSYHNEEGARLDDPSNDESGEAEVVKPKKKKRKHDEELMISLTSRRDASLKAIEDIGKQIKESQQKSHHEGWINWMSGVARVVPEDRWDTFHEETFLLFKRYIKKADKAPQVAPAAAAGTSQQYQPAALVNQVPMTAHSIGSQGHPRSPAVMTGAYTSSMGQSVAPAAGSLQPAHQSNQNQYTLPSITSTLENNSIFYNSNGAPY